MPVTLPMQASGSVNRTILGAVGKVDGAIHFFYHVADSTRKETVVEFFEKMKREAPFNMQEITLVTDNHSAHKSRLVRSWLEREGVRLMLLPVYSSTLSPVERVWSMFKARWAKALSKVKVQYRIEGIDRDISIILDKIREDLGPSILRAADKYIERVNSGLLV